MRFIGPTPRQIATQRSRAGYASIYALLMSVGVVGVFELTP